MHCAFVNLEKASDSMYLKGACRGKGEMEESLWKFLVKTEVEMKEEEEDIYSHQMVLVFIKQASLLTHRVRYISAGIKAHVNAGAPSVSTIQILQQMVVDAMMYQIQDLGDPILNC